MSDDLVVRRARVAGHGELVDVRVSGGVVASIGPAWPAGMAVAGDRVIDADGGHLLPGLHDHHIHLMATAAEAGSVRVGPPEVVDADGFRRALLEADRALPPGGWLRATGYHHSVAGDLDRDALDRIVPGRPVRVQDRSGARWTLNRAGLEALDLEPRAGPSGRLHRADELLRERLHHAAPPDLGALGRELAARGVTGVTDTTPYRSLEDLRAIAGADLPQRVVVTGGPELAGAAAPAGLEWGPVKLVIDDAGYPSPEELGAGITAAHRNGRPVAIHCVTRTALALAVAAWDAAGARPGDRVEHGSVVPPDLAVSLVRLGLTVVTQPGFVAERGDEYLAEVDPDDVPHLYPCRSLIDAGVPVMGSTDAPYTRPDPWAAIAAAVGRTTRAGAVVGPGERVTPAQALRLFTQDPLHPGRDRTVEPGAPADLCLRSDGEVRATVRAGEVIFPLDGATG